MTREPTLLEGEVAEAGRLDVAVAEAFADLSRSQGARLIDARRVQVDGEVVTKRSTAVEPGARLRVEVPPARPAEAVPQALPLDLVYEDDDLAVISKQPGRVVHPAPGHPDGTTVNALLHHLDDLSGIGGVTRPGLVHRLDRGTSGLMVVAKHDVAHRHLQAQFADHSAGRRYLALCAGQPEADAGTIRSRLARHPKDRFRYASTDDDRGKEAITHWRVVVRKGRVSVIECRLETGRTHQVRVHLAEQWLPLAGDPTYKRKGRPLPARLRRWVQAHPDRPLLHAWRLELTHPGTGERRVFVAAPPDDYQAALRSVGLEETVADWIVENS